MLLIENLSTEEFLRIDQLGDSFDQKLIQGNAESIATVLSSIEGSNGFLLALAHELVGQAREHGRLDLIRDFSKEDKQGYWNLLALAKGKEGRVAKEAWFPKDPRFRQIKLLGIGGMGAVYQAYDVERRIQLALKASCRVDAEALRQFKREFRCLSELVHPSLVRFYDFFGLGERFFFTMEMVHGQSLFDHVRGRVQGEQEYQSLFLEIAKGLCYLHENGLIHRDLKPSNVLVDERDQPRIIDFGLVWDLHSKQGGDGNIVGTLEYMAPELLRGGDVSESSDWYSFGTLLHECLKVGDIESSDLIDLCSDCLREDPEFRPTDDEVLRRLGAEQTQALPSSRLFIGREKELCLLEGLLDQTPSFGIISGASGEGKTFLLEHFLESVGEDALVLSSRCYQHESVEFPGLDGLIDQLVEHWKDSSWSPTPSQSAALIRMFPVFGNLDVLANADASLLPEEPQMVRSWAVVALLKFLDSIGKERPLVLCIDDFHWGGENTIPLLAEMFADFPRCLLLVATRPSSAMDRLLEHLQSFPGSLHIQLEPFTSEEVARFAIEMGAEHQRKQLEERSEGHPYLLNELLLSQQGSRGDLVGVLADRIHRLRFSHRSLLDQVALASSPLPKPSDRESHQVLISLEEEALVSIEGQCVVPFHDAIRVSIDRLLSEPEKRRYHLLLADIFLSNGECSQEVAHHFECAGKPVLAAQHYEAAACQSALGFERAADCLKKALELEPEASFNVLSARHGRLAKAYEQARINAEAARHYERAGRMGRSPENRKSLLSAARLYCSVGLLEEGREIVAELLQESGLQLVQRMDLALVQFLLRRTRVRWSEKRIDRSLRAKRDERLDWQVDVISSIVVGLCFVDSMTVANLLSLSCNQVLKSSDEERIGRVLALDLFYTAVLGHRLKKATNATEWFAERWCVGVGNPVLEGMYHTGMGVSLHCRSEFARAAKHLESAGQILKERCRGVGWELAVCQTNYMWSLSFLGRFPEMKRVTECVLDDSKKRQDLFVETNIKVYMLPLVHLMDDDPVRAQLAIDEGLDKWGRKEFHIQHATALQGQTMVFLYGERGQEAWDFLLRELARMRHSGLYFIEFLQFWVADYRCRAALSASMTAVGYQRKKYLRFVARKIKTIKRSKHPPAQGLAYRLEGCLLLLKGRGQDALIPLEKAQREFEHLSMEGFALCVKHLIGQIQGSEDDLEKDFKRLEIRNPRAFRRSLLGVY